MIGAGYRTLLHTQLFRSIPCFRPKNRFLHPFSALLLRCVGLLCSGQAEARHGRQCRTGGRAVRCGTAGRSEPAAAVAVAGRGRGPAAGVAVAGTQWAGGKR